MNYGKKPHPDQCHRSFAILYTRLGASNSPTSSPPADRRPKNTKFSWKLRFTEPAKLLRAAFGGLWDRTSQRSRTPNEIEYSQFPSSMHVIYNVYPKPHK